MTNRTRLVSGRVPVSNSANVTSDRYQYLDLSSAEPNLGTANTGDILSYNPANPGQRQWISQNAIVGTIGISAYAQANSASANTLYIYGVDAWQNTQLIAINTFAASAYNQANTASANTIYTQGVDLTQNTNITAVNTYAASGYGVANTASANTVYTQGVDAYQNTQITAVNTYANSAYAFANSVNSYAYGLGVYSNTTFFQKSGGTVGGSVSILGNLQVTGNITYVGNVTSQVISGNTGQFFGYSSNGFNALYAGIPTNYLIEPNTIFQATGNNNNYVQINLQNINPGGNASVD